MGMVPIDRPARLRAIVRRHGIPGAPKEAADAEARAEERGDSAEAAMETLRETLRGQLGIRPGKKRASR
jgi:hypothetical protein